MFALLADVVLIVHFAFVIFVVVTLPLIVVGGYRQWQWVRIPWLRYLHLVGIAIVVAQSWLGMICPLTTLEMWLRQHSGLATYDTSFIAHWIHRLLFWQAPTWAFTLIYTVFGLVVVVSWVWVPPRRTRGRGKSS